ncbi:MAG: NAD-dependent dehydratase [Alphaproteobacteria bacterium]|nr:NAD-dependent dehydratase [Alphaproteobacteria bacterium]
MNRTLVTGCAGFIGSHLCNALLKKGYHVFGIDNLSNGKLSNIEAFRNKKKFQFFKIDINEKKIDQILNNVDIIFHLAALADIVPSIKNPELYFNSNVNGTFNLVRSCEKKNIKKIVFAASSSCYGIPKKYPTSENSPILPQYPYALTKRLGEQIIFHFGNLYKIPVVSLRLFNVYGPRARTFGTYGAVFGVFMAQKLAKKPFTVVGDGKQTRDFTYVDDVVNAFIEMTDNKIKNEIFNVGSGQTYSVNNLVKLLGNNKVVNIPKRPGEPDCTFADISKILKKTKWKPKISLEDGVKKLMKSINEFKDAPVWDPVSIANETKDWFKYLS